MITYFKYLYHPKTKKLNLTNHFIQRLYERKGLTVEALSKHIKGFIYHRGNKYCSNSLVINSKISKGEYPNADYLYSTKMDLIIVFDRDTKYILTVLDYNTSYYSNNFSFYRFSHN